MLTTINFDDNTLPLTDALIATIAQRHQVSVLTIDKHFRYLSVQLC